MLRKLKKRLLGDRETMGQIRQARSVFEHATDREQFAKAFVEGDFETAEKYHEWSEEEIRSHASVLVNVGAQVAEEYPELDGVDKEEFLQA